MKKIYIGKIIEYYSTDSEYLVAFMEQKVRGFQWPIHQDVLWVKEEDFIQILPIPSEGRRRYAQEFTLTYSYIVQNRSGVVMFNYIFYV